MYTEKEAEEGSIFARPASSGGKVIYYYNIDGKPKWNVIRCNFLIDVEQISNHWMIQSLLLHKNANFPTKKNVEKSYRDSSSRDFRLCILILFV